MRKIFILLFALLSNCTSSKKKKEDINPSNPRIPPPVFPDIPPKGPGSLPIDPNTPAIKIENLPTKIISHYTDGVHNVMVVDRGIDSEHEVYKDKVLAKYMLSCKNYYPIFQTKIRTFINLKNEIQVLNFPQIKAEYLKYINGDTQFFFEQKCELQKELPTIQYELNADEESNRKIWNNAMKKRDRSMILNHPKIYKYLTEQIREFHGTAVTSTLAYKNDNVKIVLVESNGGGLYIKDSCHEAIRFYPVFARLYKDPEVRAQILKKATLVSHTKALDGLAKAHSVSLINKSYSSTFPTMKEKLPSCIEDVYQKAAEYHILQNEINAKLAKRDGIYFDKAPYLTLQSAGNQSFESNSKKEIFSCSGEKNHLQIGSYSFLSKERSDFSNYGACVDLYGIGENVFATIPQRYLLPAHGTSFAAPLVLRFLSENYPDEKDPLKLREYLLDALESEEKPFLPAGPYARHALLDSKGRFQLFDDFWKYSTLLERP